MKKQNITRRLSRGLLTATILTIGNVVALAHPGHSLHDESVSHTLTSPYHLATLALLGGALLVGALFVRRLVARRTLQFAGFTALCVAAVTAVTQLMH
jgi:hypothetical protein